MNDEQLHAAFYHLIAIGQLVLPHNALPGSKPGGLVEGIGENEASWLAYTWNPPQFLRDLPGGTVADTDASDKPTYAELVVASRRGQALDLRKHALNIAKDETQRRIIVAYGATSFDDEVMLRLRNESTTQQDIERDRLRAVYQALKVAINTADVHFVWMLDIHSDSLWAAN